MALSLFQRLSRIPRPLPPQAASALFSGEFSFPSAVIGDADCPVIPGGVPPPSMELMAVPKKKVSRHKKGLRNGPKALKPIPVIIRCKSCGRVKLPHFYCCSGDRGTGASSES